MLLNMMKSIISYSFAFTKLFIDIFVNPNVLASSKPCMQARYVGKSCISNKHDLKMIKRSLNAPDFGHCRPVDKFDRGLHSIYVTSLMHIANEFQCFCLLDL